MWVEGVVSVEKDVEFAWLPSRFTGTHRQLTRHVPDGYSAYCRVLHRPVRQDGRDLGPLRWSDIAADTDSVIHSGVQWHRLIGSATTDNDSGTVSGHLYADWNGYVPLTGQIDALQFRILTDMLTRHTATASDVFFGFWEGNGHFNDHDGSFFPDVDPARFWLGGREHIVLRGDLAAVSRVQPDPWPTPNAMWPVDRSWYLATEVDFDSTIIAGAPDLVDELVAHPDLEALHATVDLDLTCFGDTIN